MEKFDLDFLRICKALADKLAHPAASLLCLLLAVRAQSRTAQPYLTEIR